MFRNHRKTALLLAAALCFIMLISASFIAANADHECCTRGKCPICYQLSMSENTLKRIASAAVISVILNVLYVIIQLNPICSAVCVTDTPVSLKVKLSN